MQTKHEKATEEVESTLSEQTRQETDIPALQQCPGVKAGLWTERMLAALGNGVKGGKWHSMMDKIYAERTLRIAWQPSMLFSRSTRLREATTCRRTFIYSKAFGSSATSRFSFCSHEGGNWRMAQ